MKIKPLNEDLKKYLIKHNLVKKFDKQIDLFLNNPSHPSLHTEILEPKGWKVYSFRIDHKYRAVFSFTLNGDIEMIDINDHYQ